MEYLIILLVIFYLYRKYTKAKESNASFERVNEFLNNDGLRKLEGTKKELELFEMYNDLMRLNKNGFISDEELYAKLEILKKGKELLDEEYPDRLTQEQYEQAIRDGETIGSIFEK